MTDQVMVRRGDLALNITITTADMRTHCDLTDDPDRWAAIRNAIREAAERVLVGPMTWDTVRDGFQKGAKAGADDGQGDGRLAG